MTWVIHATRYVQVTEIIKLYGPILLKVLEAKDVQNANLVGLVARNSSHLLIVERKRET